MAATSPITPKVLAWGIEEDGRTVAEIADAVGVEPADLVAWMSGDSQPRVGQLTDLAKTLKRPRAFFFLPSPPSSSTMPDGFRHPPGATDRAVPSTVLIEARRAQRLQRAIAATVAEDEKPQVPRSTTKESAQTAAVSARTWLRVPDNAKWSGERDALRYWRGALDDAGVLVFQLQLGVDQVRGFASWDDRAPLVVMNQSGVTPPARLFTLGHELGHLVLREATACVEPEGTALTLDNRTERWCEQFSAALLMPDPAVRELMRQRSIGRGKAGLDEVRTMMTAFRVSARAAALRLADLQFAEDRLYSQVLAVFLPPKRPQDGTPRNPPRYQARLRQYGLRGVSTVLHSFPENDALSILRMDVQDVRRLADEVPGVIAL